MHKKGLKLKTSPLIKNLQFSSNLADIQAKLPINEVVILTKFHKDCKNNCWFFTYTEIFGVYPFLCITYYVQTQDKRSSHFYNKPASSRGLNENVDQVINKQYILLCFGFNLICPKTDDLAFNKMLFYYRL